MAQIREIKKRMTAVGTIQRITKTMQMIATAKFTAALQRSQGTRPFTDKIRHLVGETIAAAGDVDHPLMRHPETSTGRELMLVITSERGLCGAYNANVLRMSLHHIREARDRGRSFDLETSGKKAIGYFRFQKIEIAHRHFIGDRPDYNEVEAIADRAIEQFIDGRYDAVRVGYMRFVSTSRQMPELVQLLPLEPELTEGSAGGPRANYEFRPSGEELLNELLPMSVRTTLFQCFNDAVVSEQIMRMVAMKAATENAAGLGKDLRRSFNRARQTQITTELMEVIGGAAALE